MKKIWILLWLFFFLLLWFMFVGLHILIDELRGREIDLKGINFVGFFTSLLFCSFYLRKSNSVVSRAKYLERKGAEKPSFEDVFVSLIDSSTTLDFNRLKKEIAHKWIITFSDDKAYVLKFRSKMSFSQLWGAAAWLKFDDNTAKIQVLCFSLHTNQKKYAKAMLKEIEEILFQNN